LTSKKKPPTRDPEPNAEQEIYGAIEPISLQEEMERSFLDYAMSVIVSRALPDVRDGLKPVHRRILYGMFDQGIRPDRPYVKCARVVGDVMGRFHPHGDAAIYDALVRMVQDFSLRHPLVDGHGSFGSTSPEDGPAAMRYTECRLAPLAMEMLNGIDENTVELIPNYDGAEIEPVVLPARFPNLLVNGSQGIAVGMATNIPPHNLGEIIDATVYMLENPEATDEELMKYVKGPDFPTGAQILGRAGIQEIYTTGRGSVKLRAVAEIEETKSGGARITVTEFPYQTSPESIAAKIADLVRAGDLDGISHVQNASAGRQPKLIIDVKRDANANVILNNLFKLTPMQTSFGVNLLALVDGVPRTLTLSQAIGQYVNYQIEVVTKRSEFRLNKAKDRAHIVEGLIKAIEMLDRVIETIKKSDDRQSARMALCAAPFSFSEIQANHILDMTLGRLTKLGRAELDEEMKKLRQTIKELEEILSDPKKLKKVIANEILEIKKAHATERKSQIVFDTGDMAIEDLIDDEEIVITMTKAGYIKAVSAAAFKTQGRGGRGVQGARLKSEDLVSHVLHSTKHAHLLMFSNRGKVYRLRAHEIPTKERTARGTPAINLLPLEPNESIETILDTRDFSSKPNLLFATKQGMVKKTPFGEYDKSRREGFIAVNLHENDELVRVIPTTGSSDIVCVTKKGMVIRFKEDDVRPVGRNAAGVKGMKLKADDEVVSCDVTGEGEADLVIITDAGYGKRIKLDKIKVQSRGGQGTKGITLSEKKGYVVAAFLAPLPSDIILVSSGGITIRTAIKQITSQSRAATGVRVMNLEPGQSVAAAAIVEN
jgi:DNA gyrase subunit A